MPIRPEKAGISPVYGDMTLFCVGVGDGVGAEEGTASGEGEAAFAAENSRHIIILTKTVSFFIS